MLRKFITKARRDRRKGFTLIELLVVVLILAILMAVALPLYLSSVTDAQKRTCRANMQTILNAEQAYRVQSPNHVYTTDLTVLTTPIGTNTTADLQAIPRCPTATGAGPDYTVALTGPGGSPVITCTAPGNHGTFQAGNTQ